MGIIMSFIGLIFGYQLFLYILAIQGRKGQEWNRITNLTPINSILVIIPTHNEEKVIGNLLNDLKKQTIKADIIVVADHCSDKMINPEHFEPLFRRVRATISFL